MASTSETGHAKNVANFEELTDYCMGFGVTYNPTKTSIKIANLQILLTNSKNVISNLNSSFPAYKNAVVAREVAYAPLSTQTTRVINSLKATDVPKQTVDNAKSFARKIQGGRASKKIEAIVASKEPITEEQHKSISASQMSYDNRIDNLDKLIKFLASQPLYNPNEAELKVAALTTMYNDLKVKNSAVLAAEVPIANARISRNDILYKENTGLVHIAAFVKSYVKSLYGATSPQYKEISGIKFKLVK